MQQKQNINYSKSIFNETTTKFIQQANVQNTLKIGQLVYLDTDGLYKPAIATSLKESQATGIVWHIVSNIGFYLLSKEYYLTYRFPLTKDYFLTSNGKVDPNHVNPLKIPGNKYDRLYVSSTTPGGFQTLAPTYSTFVGYNMENGILFRSEIPTTHTTCISSDYICVYTHTASWNCNTTSWDVTEATTSLCSLRSEYDPVLYLDGLWIEGETNCSATKWNFIENHCEIQNCDFEFGIVGTPDWTPTQIDNCCCEGCPSTDIVAEWEVLNGNVISGPSNIGLSVIDPTIIIPNAFCTNWRLRSVISNITFGSGSITNNTFNGMQTSLIVTSILSYDKIIIETWCE